MCVGFSQNLIRNKTSMNMKQLILISFLSLITAISPLFSQYENVDFEPAGLGAGWTWIVDQNADNPPLEIVANPAADPVNMSATAAKFTARLTGQPWALTYTDGLDEASKFSGAAVYLNLGLNDALALGTRYEYFTAEGPSSALGVDGSVNAITLSANIGGGALKLIPEVRFDFADQEIFVDGDDAATKSAGQVLVGAVYAF